MRERWSLHDRAGPAGLLLIVGWTLVPLLTLLWLVPEMRALAQAAAVTELVTYPLLLMAAVGFYVHARISSEERTAWITVAIVFGTSQGAAYAVLRVADPEAVLDRPGLMLLVDLLVAAVVLGLIRGTGRRRLPGDPLAIGLLLGLTVTVLRLVMVWAVAPSLTLQALQTVMVGIVIVLLLATVLTLLTRLPDSVGRSLAAVVVLLGTGHLLTHPAPPEDVRSLVVIVADLVGAFILAVTTWRLLQRALREPPGVLALQDQLEVAEAEVRQDRTLLHEVATAVAGIAAASELLTSTPLLADAQRQRMLRMLALEGSRLGRLAERQEGEAGVEIDLDATLEPVLVAQTVQGRPTEWRPCGLRAVGSADQVTQVVGILLDNAARHAGATTTRVAVSRTGDSVDITVSDDGRGMSAEVAARAFEWGVRGPLSAGQGIGLHVAHALASRQGGTLTVLPGAGGRGTSVTLSLPATTGELSGLEHERA